METTPELFNSDARRGRIPVDRLSLSVGSILIHATDSFIDSPGPPPRLGETRAATFPLQALFIPPPVARMARNAGERRLRRPGPINFLAGSRENDADDGTPSREGRSGVLEEAWRIAEEKRAL